MTSDPRGYSAATAAPHGRSAVSGHDPRSAAAAPPQPQSSVELRRALADVKGQAQFILYLADQIEGSFGQLRSEPDPGHALFLCKILSMYAHQLESKHQGLGDRIAEACQEVYLALRELEADLEP